MSLYGTGQNALGSRREHKMPNYYITKMGRVSSVTNYIKQGKIEVIFLDGGTPMPVWASGHIDREPSIGDMVIVGYAEGRKDAPYVVSFVRNSSMTANYIHIKKNKITLQLPKDTKDEEKRMLVDANKAGRPYIEITPQKMVLNHPNDIEVVAKGDIKLNATGDVFANGTKLGG